MFQLIINNSQLIIEKAHIIAKVAQLVEHDLAKVGVAGSSPVFRSNVLSLSRPDGGMVDTKDLKSFGFTAVRVQVPLRVPLCG